MTGYVEFDDSVVFIFFQRLKNRRPVLIYIPIIYNSAFLIPNSALIYVHAAEDFYHFAPQSVRYLKPLFRG